MKPSNYFVVEASSNKSDSTPRYVIICANSTAHAKDLYCELYPSYADVKYEDPELFPPTGSTMYTDTSTWNYDLDITPLGICNSFVDALLAYARVRQPSEIGHEDEWYIFMLFEQYDNRYRTVNLKTKEDYKMVIDFLETKKFIGDEDQQEFRQTCIENLQSMIRRI